jgi:hypothetical protein
MRHSLSLFPFFLYMAIINNSLAAPSLPLHAVSALVSLPAELIDKIQSFCCHQDLLALTAVDKAAFITPGYSSFILKLQMTANNF